MNSKIEWELFAALGVVAFYTGWIAGGLFLK